MIHILPLHPPSEYLCLRTLRLVHAASDSPQSPRALRFQVQICGGFTSIIDIIDRHCQESLPKNWSTIGPSVLAKTRMTFCGLKICNKGSQSYGELQSFRGDFFQHGVWVRKSTFLMANMKGALRILVYPDSYKTKNLPSGLPKNATICWDETEIPKRSVSVFLCYIAESD